MLREANGKSLKGSAGELIRYLGPTVKVSKIIAKLETVYGTTASFDTLMQKLYFITPKIKVQVFATKLEEALNHIHVLFPN